MNESLSYRSGTAEERVAEVVDAFMERVRRGDFPAAGRFLVAGARESG